MFKRYPTPQTVWMSCGFEGSSSSLSRRRLTCTDVTGDILPIFQGKIELIERGALDGLTREDIARFAPRGDDYVLVSRLCDGSSVTFGESYTVDRLQNGICELERGGAAAIMVFCTGRFPETLTSRVPMIFPCDLLHKTVPLLTAASEAVIEKDGCRLTLALAGRDGVPSPGVYREKGKSGNLPSGEAYIAPLEDGSNGEMIIDGSMVGVGKLRTPLHVTVREGRLRAITGEGSEKLGILTANERNSTLGELGIGTNMAAILNGIILEDEKVYGTVHIAFGTNTSFGGTNKADCHMDGIILKPTLYLDGRKIIDHGEFLV